MVTKTLSVGALALTILGSMELGPARAQYMALTPEDAPAHKAEIAPPPAPLPPPRPSARVLDGDLPNQRTGPKRERVVRDICIGCDR